MKKISIILALTLVLVAAFAATALADYTNFSASYNVTSDQTTGLAVPSPNGNTNWGGGAGLWIKPTTGQWGQTTDPTAVYLPGDPSKQPIHSNYQANTDACAACHAVHTGNGDALTQWSTYNTAGLTNVCMACHDGTVTRTYNVEAGTFVAADNGTINHNNGGLFAVEYGQNTSASEHNVFGGLLTSAAFGGSNPSDIVADASGTGTSDQSGNWNVDFTCVACHTPHGQGANARILDPNPNYVQTKGYAPDGHTPSIQAVYTTHETATLSNATTYTIGGRAILGYPYNFSVTVNGSKLNQYTQYNLSLDPTTGNTTITFKSPQTGSLDVGYVPALKVTFNVANKLTSTEKVTYMGGLNQFCGACHTDYNTENIYKTTDTSASELNGTYSQHTRHAVGYTSSSAIKEARGLRFQYSNLSDASSSKNGVVTCLTCHVAHGVDKSIWALNAAQSGIAAYNTDELAGSSRLKRLPNMGVCEACHEKGNGAYSGDFAAQTGFTGPSSNF